MDDEDQSIHLHVNPDDLDATYGPLEKFNFLTLRQKQMCNWRGLLFLVAADEDGDCYPVHPRDPIVPCLLTAAQAEGMVRKWHDFQLKLQMESD